MTNTTLPSWIPAEEGAEIHSSSLDLEEGSTFTVSFWCDAKTVSFQFFQLCEAISEGVILSRADAMLFGAQAEKTSTSDHFPISGLDVKAVRTFGHRLWIYGKDGK